MPAFSGLHVHSLFIKCYPCNIRFSTTIFPTLLIKGRPYSSANACLALNFNLKSHVNQLCTKLGKSCRHLARISKHTSSKSKIIQLFYKKPLHKQPSARQP